MNVEPEIVTSEAFSSDPSLPMSAAEVLLAVDEAALNAASRISMSCGPPLRATARR